MLKEIAVSAISMAKDIYSTIHIIIGIFLLLISVMLLKLYCPMALRR